jgi:hypothetical protein
MRSQVETTPLDIITGLLELVFQHTITSHFGSMETPVRFVGFWCRLIYCKSHHIKWLHHAGDLVAHIKFTVLLMPNGSDKITSHPLQELKPTKSIEDNAEIKAWLALGTKSKKKGGGKKKKGLSHVHSTQCSLFCRP